jgi:hypothetical protein
MFAMIGSVPTFARAVDAADDDRKPEWHFGSSERVGISRSLPQASDRDVESADHGCLQGRTVRSPMA